MVDPFDDLRLPDEPATPDPAFAARLRRRVEAELLPELPVPGRFQRLFRDWADNRVDFVGSAQHSAEGGGVV